MATLITKTVGPSGRDYTTLEAALPAEKAIRSDLAGRDEKLLILCDAFLETASGEIQINGWTTNSTCYVEVSAASGAEHNGDPTEGYRVTQSTGFATIAVGDNYHRVNGITVTNTRTSTASRGFECFGSTEDIVISNCIGRVTNGGNAANGGVFYSNSDVLFYNCLAFGSASANGFTLDAGADTSSVYSCTAVGCTRGFVFDSGANTLNLRNCVAYDNTDYDFGSTAGSFNSSTNNASGDLSAIGTSAVTGITSSDFVDYAGGDYTPASGGALDGAGVDLSAFFTDDITGATRTVPWDIGAFAVVGGGGTAVAPSPFQSLQTQFAVIAASKLNGVLQ